MKERLGSYVKKVNVHPVALFVSNFVDFADLTDISQTLYQRRSFSGELKHFGETSELDRLTDSPYKGEQTSV